MASTCSCGSVAPRIHLTVRRRAHPQTAARRIPIRGQPQTSASSASDAADAAERLRTPHSGYHRLVGFPRPFFEGWYFRVTLPEARDNISLVYHVFDPDLPDSPRRGAGAQVCAPNGKYIFRESTAVEEFSAEPHELALRMRTFGAARGWGGDAGASAEEFYEVTEHGARHRGRLLRGGEVNDPSVWPPEKCAGDVSWDITVRPVVGNGGGGGGGSVKTGGDDSQMSTAGWLSSLPVFEPHYQVTMAHGLASGWMEADGVRTDFEDCPAYSEKNWGGAGFPSKWFWVQCNSFPEAPGLSVTATGGDRGVVILPGLREEVAAVLVHTGTGAFYPFVPAGSDVQEAAKVLMLGPDCEVAPWGSWSVTAKTSTHEVRVTAAAPPLAASNTTVLRAPQDDTNAGMAPLCRESFKGTVEVSMWELDPATGRRGAAVLDGVTSDTAAVEVGGGPWYAPWTGLAELKEPLGSLATIQVDVQGLARLLKPFVDIVPGL